MPTSAEETTASNAVRDGFTNIPSSAKTIPRGLKPVFSAALGVTAKAVTYPRPFMKPALVRLRLCWLPILVVAQIKALVVRIQRCTEKKENHAQMAHFLEAPVGGENA